MVTVTGPGTADPILGSSFPVTDSPLAAIGNVQAIIGDGSGTSFQSPTQDLIQPPTEALVLNCCRQPDPKG